jgi:hypothetical protein
MKRFVTRALIVVAGHRVRPGCTGIGERIDCGGAAAELAYSRWAARAWADQPFLATRRHGELFIHPR